MLVTEERIVPLARYYHYLWNSRKLWQARVVTTLNILDTDTLASQVSFDLDLERLGRVRHAFGLDNYPQLALPLVFRPVSPLLDVSIQDDQGSAMSIARKRTNTTVGALYLLGLLICFGLRVTRVNMALLEQLREAVKNGSTGRFFDYFISLSPTNVVASKEEMRELRAEFQSFDATYILCCHTENLFEKQRSHAIIKFSTLMRWGDSDVSVVSRRIGATRLFALKFPMPLIGFGEGRSGVHVRVKAPGEMVIDDFQVHIPVEGDLERREAHGGLYHPTKGMLLDSSSGQKMVELYDIGVLRMLPGSVVTQGPMVVTLVLNPVRRTVLIPALIVSLVTLVATGILLAKAFFTSGDLEAGNEIAVYSILLPVVVTLIGTRREHILAFRSIYAARFALVVMGVAAMLTGIVVGLEGYGSQLSEYVLAVTMALSALSALISGFQVIRIELMRRLAVRRKMTEMVRLVHTKIRSRRRFIYYAINPRVYWICSIFLLRTLGEMFLEGLKKASAILSEYLKRFFSWVGSRSGT